MAQSTTSESLATPYLPFTILETPRLLLQLHDPTMMQHLLATRTDAELMYLLGLASEAELEQEKKRAQQGLSTYRISFCNFMIIEREGMRVIGMAGYHTWYLQHARAELGYALKHDSDKKKGYMTEAVAALLQYGFEVMKLHRIEALVGPSNTPSLRLMKRFGFVEEGLLRAHYYKEGVYHDSLSFSLLAHEYTPTPSQ